MMSSHAALVPTILKGSGGTSCQENRVAWNTPPGDYGFELLTLFRGWRSSSWNGYHWFHFHDVERGDHVMTDPEWGSVDRA